MSVPVPDRLCDQLHVPLSFPLSARVTPALAEMSGPLTALIVNALLSSMTELATAVDETCVAWLRMMVPVLAAPLALKFTRPDTSVSGPKKVLAALSVICPLMPGRTMLIPLNPLITELMVWLLGTAS